MENKRTKLAQNPQLNILTVSGSFSMQDLFDAFNYYAFTSISNQPFRTEICTCSKCRRTS